MTGKKKSTIIKEGQDTPNAPKHRHYLDNEAFYQALYDRRMHIDAGEQVPQRLEDYIGDCLMRIAEGVGKRWNFAKYSWRDEMVGDAIVACTRAIDKFDVHQFSNPLAYFTQCTVYAFLARLQQEENQTYTKYKMMIEAATAGELDSADDEDAAHVLDNVDVSMDYMIDYIERHEAKKARKKKGSKKNEQSSSSLNELYNEEVDNESENYTNSE